MRFLFFFSLLEAAALLGPPQSVAPSSSQSIFSLFLRPPGQSLQGLLTFCSSPGPELMLQICEGGQSLSCSCIRNHPKSRSMKRSFWKEPVQVACLCSTKLGALAVRL